MHAAPGCGPWMGTGFRQVLAALALCLTSLPPRAEVLLVPAQLDASAGGPIRIDLLVTNETALPTTFEVPEALHVRLTHAGAALDLVLERDPASVEGTLELAPQQMRRIAYHGTLPATLRGPVVLRAVELTAAPAMLDIAAPASIADATSPAAAARPEPAAPAAEETAPAATPVRDGGFTAALSAYEPVYLAAGGNDSFNAKFQLSLKFRFFNERAGLARRYGFVEDLYFGYTQTSLWDLDAPSAPFDDTSYKPRLFYSTPSAWTARSRALRLGVETGFGHESNGRDGTASRSINVAYVRPSLVFGRADDWQLTFAPLLSDYLEKHENPDIDKYRGHVDWSASLGKADSAQLAGTYRRGSDGWSVQLDLTYPLHSIALGNLNGYLHAQYFDGWGESLLRYDERFDPQYRLGLMFVR